MKKSLSMLFCVPFLFQVSFAIPVQQNDLAKWYSNVSKFDAQHVFIRVMGSPEPAQEELPSESEEPPPEEALDEEGVQKAYKELGFNPKGHGEGWQAVTHHDQIETVWNIKGEAFERTRKCYPNHKRVNDEADAFRHAYFNCRLSSEIGVKDTKEWADAHEISHVNPDGVRLMDLQNNNVGRDLSKGLKTPEECEKAVKQAICDGKLTLKPVKVINKGDGDGSASSSSDSID